MVLHWTWVLSSIFMAYQSSPTLVFPIHALWPKYWLGSIRKTTITEQMKTGKIRWEKTLARNGFKSYNYLASGRVRQTRA